MKVPTLLAYGNESTLYGDVAQFLLTRGAYGYLGYGWHGLRQTRAIEPSFAGARFLFVPNDSPFKRAPLPPGPG